MLRLTNNGAAGVRGLGKEYKDGDVIFRQGEVGDCMFVIQQGQVEVVVEEEDGREVVVATRGEREFVGEMAIFEREVRSATVRARGDTRVLTIDKRNLLRWVHEDPSLAFRILQSLSHRVRELTGEVAHNRATGKA